MFCFVDRYGNLESRDWSLVRAARTSWYVPNESDLQHVVRDILPACPSCWVDGDHNFWVPIETHPELAALLQDVRQSEWSLFGWLLMAAGILMPICCVLLNCTTFVRGGCLAILAASPSDDGQPLLATIPPPAQIQTQAVVQSPHPTPTAPTAPSLLSQVYREIDRGDRDRLLE